MGKELFSVTKYEQTALPLSHFSVTQPNGDVLKTCFQEIYFFS